LRLKPVFTEAVDFPEVNANCVSPFTDPVDLLAVTHRSTHSVLISHQLRFRKMANIKKRDLTQRALNLLLVVNKLVK